MPTRLNPSGEKHRRPGVICLVILSTAFGAGLVGFSRAGQSSALISRTGLELQSIDRSADPCSDFYQFACGSWMTAHPIPPDLAGIGRGREMRTRTFGLLSRILTETTRDPERQKANRYFHACVDEGAIEARGMTPIEPVLRRIRDVRTNEELPTLLAFLHNVAFQPAPSSGLQPTYRALFEFRSHYEIGTQIAVISQSGMALPYRQIYLATDPRTSMLRTGYLAHIRETFRMLGIAPDVAAVAADSVLKIETALAVAALDTMDLRAVQSQRMSLTELQSITPHFSWREYLQAAPASMTQMIEVATPRFVRAVDAIIADSSVDSLKAYLQWQVVRASIMMMPRAFREADFEFFARGLRGQKQQTDRAELCVAETDDRLGGIVGKAFVEETFGPKSRSEILALVSRLTIAMGDAIDTSSWLSDETKRAARAKLASMVIRMGHPDRWLDYSALDIRSGDALGNRQRALTFERVADLQKIGRPRGPDDWPRVSITVGEPGYHPQNNTLVFPAGFLQPPFYDVARDPAVNYGAIGAMIGHEITHGFDDIGRRLDERGRWRDWWTAADARAFEDRAACLIGQYSQFRVAGDVPINARLTLGENIADSGGIRLALLAYLAGPSTDSGTVLDGFTPQQRVFLGWAQAWCQNVRPEAERLGASTDPHAPGRYRVNGPLANMPEFHAAFSCKPGAPMVRQAMCRVW